MYLHLKKQGLKALKWWRIFTTLLCPAYRPNNSNNYTCKALQPGSCCLCPLQREGSLVGMWHREAAAGLRVVALPFLAPQTAPAPRFGSNTPPCSPAPQKSLAPKTKRLIMEIMQIRRELQITSSSPASVSTARPEPSQGILGVGKVWELPELCRAETINWFILGKSPQPALVEGLTCRTFPALNSSMDLWVRLRAVRCCSPSWLTLGSMMPQDAACAGN